MRPMILEQLSRDELIAIILRQRAIIDNLSQKIATKKKQVKHSPRKRRRRQVESISDQEMSLRIQILYHWAGYSCEKLARTREISLETVQDILVGRGKWAQHKRNLTKDKVCSIERGEDD